MDYFEPVKGEQGLVGIKGEPGPNGSAPRVYAAGLGGGPGGWHEPAAGCPHGERGPNGSSNEPEMIDHLLTAIGRYLQGASHYDSNGNRWFTGLGYFEMIQIESVLKNYRRLLTEPLYQQLDKR